MSRRVVTISQTSGAARADVAAALARRLGFRYVNEEIVEQVAARQGVDESAVRDVERRRTFLQSLWEALDTPDNPGVAAIAHAGGAYVPEQAAGGSRQTSPSLLRELIREVIRETADRGEVVIASHAASFACAGRPDVLRVLVTASPETRAQRIARESGVDEREAGWAVEESDRGRADYLKRFYEVERELPTHYDVVVNTDALTAAEAVELIVAAAG
jgi:cytidylate kinase